MVKYVNQGALRDAQKYSSKLLKKYPKSAQLLNIIGSIYLSLGKNRLAEETFRKALGIIPNYFEPLYNLGILLSSLDRESEANSFLLKAVNSNPNSFLAFHKLANSYKKLDQAKEAITCYKRSLHLNPKYVPSLNNLGIIYSHLSKNHEASQCFKRILSIKPDWSTAHRHLSLVLNYSSKDTHLSNLESALKKKLEPLDEIQLRYAHFKAMSDLGNTGAAFESLQIANNLRKINLGYCIDNDLKILEKIKNTFVEKTKNIRGFGCSKFVSEKKMLFVIGMPRSGTTLVEQILSSHSKVYGAGEIAILNNEFLPIFSASIEQKEAILNSTFFKPLHHKYHSFIERINPTRPFTVDKMPINFLWVGFIQILFPNAKIIHVLREPMAVIWSNYKHYFAGKEMSFSHDLSDILKYFQGYQNLMSFWEQNTEKKIFDLSYEKLTENTKSEVAKLLQYCCLEWEDSCLEFHKTDRLVKTASRNQVRQSIYRGSSKEWKKYERFLTHIEESLR